MRAYVTNLTGQTILVGLWHFIEMKTKITEYNVLQLRSCTLILDWCDLKRDNCT